MRELILASKSKARKEILENLGFKVKVFPSHIRERREIKTSCAVMVMANALDKAKDVATKFNHGVIVASDTVVLDGKQTFGKPVNIKEARQMLRRFSKRPHLVYSGIAVIDILTGKTIVSWEKTKIYLEKLSDAEINAYFLHVKPYNLAGGFDIQGKGALFIKRIEGDYYNVVGLPVYKLGKMLKKIGVNIV
ncbi:MAG: Maf family protein [Candidatus Omnitrophota bacterium]